MSRGGGVALWGEVERAGEVDPRVGVTLFAASHGEPLACLFRYTAHPIVLTGESNVISADWPGYARANVSEALGCPAIFLQGSAGDIAPGGRGSPEAVVKMGEGVGNEAGRAAGGEPHVQQHGCRLADRHLDPPR